MNAYDTDEVDTPAGVYTIESYYDESPEQPYNDGLGFAFDGGRESIDQAMGEHADEVLSILRNNGTHRGNRYSSEGIARYLRIKYGLKGIRQVTADYFTGEPSSDRGESFQGLAWAPDDATYPDKYTDGSIAEYRAWATGEVYGYVVNGPDDEHVDSCWGFLRRRRREIHARIGYGSSRVRRVEPYRRWQPCRRRVRRNHLGGIDNE